MTLGIALFDLFAFVQFTARGFVNLTSVPPWIHLHALVMIGWLALFVVQPTLIRKGDVVRHRQVGLLAVALAAAVVILGGYSAVMTLRTHHVPGFFAAPYFLMLTLINLVAFAGLVVAAIHASRHDPSSHPRLIVAANVLILEPALGRLLPFPLIQPWGEFSVMVIQLGVLAVMARHDLVSLGRIHRATLAGMGVVAFSHSLIEMTGHLPAAQRLAEAIALG
ncbi:hypothetical protein HT136_22575 [Novosphingobium profundi]|uniref:hypothetical protein n=1 Tax=Novosphingobium profundi TaxID=1774954 RepID=UPI001BDB0174|nr:hypothetical protein [Novosphingobium profundi]MBT0671161.1 hypothetical protein [Novosphingobium profundi]